MKPTILDIVYISLETNDSKFPTIHIRDSSKTINVNDVRHISSTPSSPRSDRYKVNISNFGQTLKSHPPLKITQAL